MPQDGITVLPPDVNSSVRNFAPVGADIRFGLGAIRNVGVNVVDAIVSARKEKGAFSDFADFLRKVDAVVCNKKVIESLIKAGAFDSLGHTRKGLLLVHADAIDAVMSTKKAASMGQFDLFGSLDAGDGGLDVAGVFDIPVPAEEWDSKHRLAIVLVKARVSRRDDRVSLIANDLAVPDLAAATGGPGAPLAVSLRADHCAPERVSRIKDVLGSHPGSSEVHLCLVNGSRVTVLKLDDGLRVTPSSALKAT